MNKSSALYVRITEEEAELFSQYAESVGETRSRILRKIVRELITEQPDLVSAELAVFKTALRQLSGATTNLNQLTRAVNSGKVPKRMTEESYWKGLRAEVKSLSKTLRQVMDATATRWVPKKDDA
ncbi:MAG: MobC family plasmid mobilization relaxosome protein [Gammaproteobacteria bacterium]|nr:MobC family plasmid mobilization relaxosome protein [Gammaproteobacteria bacterium]